MAIRERRSAENRLRGSPIMVLSEWGFAGIRLARPIASPSEKADLARDDFRAGALAAAVLRLVLAGRQPSFDIHLAALAQKFRACLRQLAEGHDAMPFSPLLFPAVAVGKPLGRRQRKIRHALTRRKSPHLGSRTQIADYRCTIQPLFFLLRPLPVLGQGVSSVCFVSQMKRGNFFPGLSKKSGGRRKK